VLTLHEATTISTVELDAVATWQGLDPGSFSKPGDFLVVRTGFTKKYRALSLQAREVLPFRPGDDAQFIGIETSDATLRWLWDKKLALVGGDQPAFEPLPLSGSIIDGVERSLHQVFIGGWGMSIGRWINSSSEPGAEFISPVEFLDLENLTEACHELSRYSFFFTIQNLNVIGGIASPPNAMAIL
jgi:kynurenine formamidase